MKVGVGMGLADNSKPSIIEFSKYIVKHSLLKA